MASVRWHALAPGHGKTLVGAYLVGSRSTPQAALWLGITTTVTHTLAVFILGMTALLASHYIDLDRIYPILGAASGVTICLVGLRLLSTRLRDKHHYHHHPHTYHHHPHTHHHPAHQSRQSIKEGLAIAAGHWHFGWVGALPIGPGVAAECDLATPNRLRVSAFGWL